MDRKPDLRKAYINMYINTDTVLSAKIFKMGDIFKF